MSLIADPTNPAFNCYVSLADANTILGTRLDVLAWDNAAEAAKTKALLTATALVDRYVTWTGSVTSQTQPLAWPRKDVRISGREGYFDDDVIPDFLKVAVTEYAAALLAENIAADQETGLSSLRVGEVSLQFRATDRKSPIPDNIRLMLSLYGNVATGRDSVIRVERR